MTPVDPMAVAVDWLDAYRALSLDQIVGMYAADARIECGCGGAKTIVGHAAIKAYWRQRFGEKPASELEELQMYGDTVIIAYRTPDGIVQALLELDDAGLITHCQCGAAESEKLEI